MKTFKAIWKFHIIFIVGKTAVGGTVNFTTKYSFETGAATNTTTTRVKEIDSNSKKIVYTYDPNGNIKTITEGNNQIIYYYDALNQLIQEDNQVLNKTVIYSYDGGGNLTQKLDIIYGTQERIYTNYQVKLNSGVV